MNDEILYHTNKSKKRKIDNILRQMASLFANVGKDSTFSEHREALRKEQELMDEIKKLDPNFEKRIRPYGEHSY